MELYIKLSNSKILESEEVERNIVFDYDEQNLIVGVELSIPDNTLCEKEVENIKTEITNVYSTIGNGLANPLLDVAHKWKEIARGRVS